MRCDRLILAGVAALAVVVATQRGSAQPQSPPAAPDPAAPRQASKSHPPPTRSAGLAQVEQHIAQLHTELKITPAQTVLWDEFAEVMRDNAQHMEGMYRQRAQAFGAMNAIESLKSYELIEQANVEDVRKLEPAFADLYSSMSDEQKQIADRMFRSNPSH